MKNLDLHTWQYTTHEGVFGIAGKKRKSDFLRMDVTNAAADGDDVQHATNLSSYEETLAWEELGLAVGFTRVVRRKQVHGVDIEVVDAASSSFDGVADALITTQTNVLLAVTVADCCGIVLWHEDVPLCACIHSGWRGTEKNITRRVVERMKTLLRFEPSHLHAWLSPCASGRSYSVRTDVQQLFPAFCTEVSDGSFLFDNSAAITAQLLECGLLPERIRVSQTCTIEDHRYHSFRRDGVNSGRNAVFVGMKSR
jgi:YfiH family protein